jgi:predicted phage tail protein
MKSDAWTSFQTWLAVGAAICVVPSAIAAVGGVWLNGGHALHGPLSTAVNAVLAVSLISGVAVIAIGFRRFLAAQARARSARDQNESRTNREG